MGASVSQRFLVGLGLTSLAFTLVTSLAAFGVFQRELEQRQIHFLSQYVQERSDNVGRRFTNLITLQKSAAEALTARIETMTPVEADAILAHHVEVKPDGSGRSVDRDFDGYVDPAGARFYGVATFVGRAREMSAEDRAKVAAAIPIVAHFGQAAHGDYDNFYFFSTAPHTRLVMFGPDRPDRLMFYRRQTPPDSDLSNQEMGQIVTPSLDPTGASRCTSLRRLLQDNKQAQQVATACLTPVYLKGRYAGAFGSSIRIDAFLNSVVDADGIGGADTLVMRADGKLIASPKARLGSGASEAQVATYEKRLGLAKLAARFQSEGRSSGVTRSPDGKTIIAYGQLKGPNWYLLISYPAAAVAWSAFKSASWVLVLGLIGAIAQTFMLVHLARRTIVQPLQALATSCETHDPEAAREFMARQDEIGILARALQAERDQVANLLTSLEQRVQRRTAQLEEANVELEQANAEKSRFLANMSHELRTPLNGVIALSETLAKEQTTPRNKEVADLIVSSGRVLVQVLSDILDFSKIEAGEMKVEAHPFDLKTLVAGVAELHRASADAKGIDLFWMVQDEAAGGYLGDGVRLTQVLSNLLSNAVKFTPAGEVALTVEESAEGLLFTIEDTGIGFDESVRARLFQRFEQADVSIRRRFGGTGLGLAICRSLVELMGGEIDARSTPGRGSAFSFVLPVERAALDAKAEAAEGQGDLSLEGVRVLLAEDHPTNRKVIELIVDTVGIDLTMVENGQLALDALAVDRFDIVLMDMQMPEMDGLTATRLFRVREAAEGLARTPVIMLTANALEEHIRASLEAGADRHISKPVHAAELLEAIAILTSTQAELESETEAA